jgi:hypothetical protein
MVRHIFFNPQKHDVAEITESEAQNNIIALVFIGTFLCVSYIRNIWRSIIFTRDLKHLAFAHSQNA